MITSTSAGLTGTPRSSEKISLKIRLTRKNKSATASSRRRLKVNLRSLLIETLYGLESLALLGRKGIMRGGPQDCNRLGGVPAQKIGVRQTLHRVGLGGQNLKRLSKIAFRLR